MTSTESRSRRSAAETRDHILTVARELFYWHGIHATGVDTIAAAAGVAPTTLYRQFSSKDDLVATYLQQSSQAYQQWFTAAVATGGHEPRQRILAVFDAQLEQVQPHQCRGCPFLMGLSEIPASDMRAHQHAVELKGWVRDQFRSMTAGLNVKEPTELADQLTLVFEGVYASVQALGVDGPARQARALVTRLLESIKVTQR